MKWHKHLREAPEYQPVLAQARFVTRTDDRGKPVWSPWTVVIAARCGEDWEMPIYWYPWGLGGRSPELVVRRWTAIPEAPPVPRPDPMKTRIGLLERQARDEELRRQGWRLNAQKPQGTQVCRILVQSRPDYGPYLERVQSVFDGALPSDTRAWQPHN